VHLARGDVEVDRVVGEYLTELAGQAASACSMVVVMA
jgi:hypothetical protein